MSSPCSPSEGGILNFALYAYIFSLFNSISSQVPCLPTGRKKNSFDSFPPSEGEQGEDLIKKRAYQIINTFLIR